MIKLNDAAVDLKTSIFNMATATGTAGDIMDGSVLSMDKLDKATASYNNKVTQVASATGMADSAVSEFLASVGSKIPGALNMLSDAADQSGNHLDSTVKMLKLASAIGMSHTDVLDRTASAYINYGTSIDKSMENLALMNKTTQEMGMNQDVMLGFIDRATSGMESMSDATGSVVQMMGSLGRVMRNEGTSIQGVSNILTGMAEGVKNMDIGQASFVNQMSGGRGGLAGGFEIEKLKQEGNIGEIVNRTMQAMERIGVGSPVTLQDVEDNPALASELMKQTELLKSFGLAKDNQDAFRVLEAMQAGAQDELQAAIEGMKDPQQMMVEKLTTANDLQSIGNQTLTRIVNSMNSVARTNALMVGEGLEGLDDVTGAETQVRRTNFGKEEIAGVTNRLTDAQTGVIGDTDTRETMMTMPGTMYSGAMGNITEMIDPLGEFLKEQMSAALEKVKEQMSKKITSASVRDDTLSLAEKTPQQRQAQGTGGAETAPINQEINLKINLHDNLQPIMEKSFAVQLEKSHKIWERKSFTGTGN